MREKFVKYSHNLIFLLVVATAVIIPIFFLPTALEFFEFNKFSAVLAVTIIGLLLWSTATVMQKKFTFTRTPLDTPIILLLAVFFIATLSSIDQYISFAGNHGRIWPGFFSVATVIIFYFLLTSNLKGKKQVEIILWTLVGATTIASLISIASFFGSFLPFEFARLRSFNPLGLVNRLAILEALVIPIASFWAVTSRDKIKKLAATILTPVLLFSLVLINFFPAYVSLLVAYLLLAAGLTRTKIDKAQKMAAATVGIFILLFLVMRFVPQVAQSTLYAWISAKDQNLTVQEQLEIPKELHPPARAGWDIASQTIGKRPLFGSGPSTFKSVYTQLKPRYLNETESWAVRFENSSSFFTELIATTGIIGTLAYLLLTIVSARLIWTLVFKSPNSALYLPIAAAITAYLVAGFLTTASFATSTTFIILLGLLAILAKAAGENRVYEVTVEVAALRNRLSWLPLTTTKDKSRGARAGKVQIFPFLFLIASLLISFFAARFQINAYRAEYFYRQSLLAAQANDGNRAVDFLQKAIRANPAVDTYHRVLAQTSLNAALNLSSRGELNEDQRRILIQLAQVAIDQGKVASGYQILPLRVPGIAATNVANWETVAAVYQALIGSIDNADVHAINTLSQAVTLDPQNPILHQRLGLLYQRQGNNDLAQRKFEDAVIVKGDFGPAHYALAKLLIDNNGEAARIVNELNQAKRFLPQDDPARPDIEENLTIYNQKLQEQRTQAPQEPGATPGPSPTPSPTPSPSPTPRISPKPSPKTSPSPSF